MSDPRLSGFFQKYGGQRATDAGPTCPRCQRPIMRHDPAAQLAPCEGQPGMLVHADCASELEWATGQAERVADGGYGPGPSR